MTAPDVLAFADKRADGNFEVSEPSGQVVAQIKVSLWSGSSFEATTGDGEPLCSGRRSGLFSSTWSAIDPEGHELASMKASFTGGRKNVVLPDGRGLTLHGRWLSREWALRDEAGRDVLTSTPTSGTWTFHPDAWVVRSHDASLDLAQVVAIVQLNRLMVKAQRSAGGAGAV